MIRQFADNGTEDVFNGNDTREARRACPRDLWAVARRKLDLLTSADSLRVPPGNHLEDLTGDRQGQHSVRINQQYRLCFTWARDGATEVEIVDYH